MSKMWKYDRPMGRGNKKKMIYNIFEPWKTLDPWQKEYIETEGDCFLLCGRQSGKSAGASIKFGDRARKKPNQIILMLGYTENQAYLLFFRCLMYLKEVCPKMICRGAKKPTKHIIYLTNGSKIMCYACGLSGEGIRGHTVTSLVIDEVSAMSRDVFTAVTPMLSITGGTLDVLSTPRGKHHKDGSEKFFYTCSKDKRFKKFYVSAEDCPRHSKEFLEHEKERMTELEYSQEYLAMFLDEVRQFFPDELIKSRMVTQMNSKVLGIPYLSDTCLGVDVARMGRDDIVLLSLNRSDRKRLKMIDMEIYKKKLLTETVRLILAKDTQYHYRRIYIDTGGLGVGVFDPLLEHPQTKRKVVSINNASKAIEYRRTTEGKPRMHRILKEDLYINLKNLMEKGLIDLWNSDEVFASLQSIQYEDDDGKITIWGSNDHIAEALKNAAWYIRDNRLRPYIN